MSEYTFVVEKKCPICGKMTRVAKTKARLRDVEAALFPAQKRIAELEALMATDELYANASAFDEAMHEYQALSKKIPVLEEEWLELTEKMEAGA
jgi:ATP-binding cassette subfamily F protein 3